MFKLARIHLVQGLMAVVLALSLTACETIDTTQPVFGGEAVDDSQMVENVKAALNRHPDTKLLRLKVSAIDDVIVLKGLVNNDQQRYTALQVAGRVEGVRHVTNNIYLRD
jgi:osmotically-inducible protein OsmY